MEIIHIFLNSIRRHMKAYLGIALFLSFGTAEASEAFGFFSQILFLSFFFIQVLLQVILISLGELPRGVTLLGSTSF
jgi:hypothetical protein